MAGKRRSQEMIESDIKSHSKVCSVCKKRVDFNSFYNSSSNVDGKANRCKVCDDMAKKKWSTSNPASQYKSMRRNNLWTKYGMTLEDYDKILTDQDSKCAICGLPEQDNKVCGKYNSLSVDHDHDTSEVRGLLCNQCNRGIGMLQDSTNILQKALNYLSPRDKGVR